MPRSLIEACRAKGTLQLGSARVSDKHANFIISTGGHDAADVEATDRLHSGTEE